ncbi:MAG TPA: hypothetical protein VFO05_01045 [Candidatus Limnocylindrales bacterium]|nr:hypothetical protein [Candidatus Limnocylindrales bacterium]
MRVRTFELRLTAAALVACWTLAAVIVLLGYRPGGPVDLAVGAAAAGPVAIAIAGLIWPPAARGSRTFTAMIWLGVGSLLLLVPSIVDVADQLVRGGAQTLLPSVEAAYPWGLALLGTSLFAGFGIARRVLGETAMRRRRLARGVIVASVLAVGAGSLFTAVAMANELALRGQPTPSSRFGPTDGDAEPPACDDPLSVGSSARIELRLAGDLDGHSIGTVDLAGDRSGADFRWLAYAATTRELGLHGAARIGGDAWVREPFGGWRRAAQRDVADGTVDAQAFVTVLGAGTRAAAELHGVDVIEGARARHCRIAIDGRSFRAAFPPVAWLVGEADLSRWRGELDYWVFLDGQLGRVTGSVNGDAGAILEGALQGTVRVSLTATARGRDLRITPPAP